VNKPGLRSLWYDNLTTMPAAVAIALRYIIMAATQLLWSLVEKYGLPLINEAVVQIAKVGGIKEEEARDVMANEFLQAFEQVGVFAATLRTKLPLKVADYLGFTTRGWSKRTLSGASAKVGVKPSGVARPNPGTIAAAEKTVVETVSKIRGLYLPSVQSFFNFTFKALGLTTAMFFAFAQYIDFANWQGPYQRFFQSFLARLGIHPDTPLPKAGVINADMWKRIYSAIEELKPQSLAFPTEQKIVPYSRQALSDLVDSVAADMLRRNIQPTFKLVWGVLLPLIQLDGAPLTDAQIAKIFSQPAPTYTSAPSPGTTTPTVKVYTGVVSQGVVGAGLSFTARPDDLIESVGELRAAATNNIAPFLAALPGKVIYEVKIVASITTKDGFRQTGTSQRIQTGTYSNGQPKYKNVINKFAVMDLFILTDRGARTRIAQIVLGPVDSARLTVQQNDLRALELELPKLVTTSDINDVQNILPPGTPDVPAGGGGFLTLTPAAGTSGEDSGWRYYSFPVGKEIQYTTAPWLGNVPFEHTPITREEFFAAANRQIAADPARWKPYYEQMRRENPNAFAGGNSGYVIKDGVPFFVGTTTPEPEGPGPSAATQPSARPGFNASSLYEFYTARGLPMPSVRDRAQMYQEAELGQSAFYTGTAEQNTKLLNYLKSY
jgi:hypothetical protein